MPQQPFLPPDFSLGKATALIGPYGSGKSELALALAGLMATRRRAALPCRFSKVALGDIDVLKPYFRSREAREPLLRDGVRLLAPAGALAGADLPILTPELRGAFDDGETQLILDVGGDPVGARALGSLRVAMGEAGCDLWLVLNRNRPFMESVAGVVEEAGKIAAATGLALGGIVSNTHMMAETTVGEVLSGLDFAREVGRALGVPVRLVGLSEGVARELERSGELNPAAALRGLPAVVLRRALLPAFLGGAALSRQSA